MKRRDFLSAFAVLPFAGLFSFNFKNVEKSKIFVTSRASAIFNTHFKEHSSVLTYYTPQVGETVEGGLRELLMAGASDSNIFMPMEEIRKRYSKGKMFVSEHLNRDSDFYNRFVENYNFWANRKRLPPLPDANNFCIFLEDGIEANVCLLPNRRGSSLKYNGRKMIVGYSDAIYFTEVKHYVGHQELGYAYGDVTELVKGSF